VRDEGFYNAKAMIIAITNTDEFMAETKAWEIYVIL